MKPFLEKIADRLVLKFPNRMEDVAVVLPSKRAVVFFKYYLSKNISKPIFLPKFYSIEEFIEDISGLNVIDNVSLQFELYQSYLGGSNKNKDSFNEFLNWGSVLLHDFNDIDTNMVDAKSLFKNLTNVKELENWNVDSWSFSNKNLTNVQKDYVSFFNSMFSVYNHFTQVLLEKKSAYQGLANRIAAERISLADFSFEKVWFVGLNALTTSQHIIIDNLKQRDIARVFWDADEYYFNNSDHEAGYFLKQQKDKWSEIDFEGVGSYFSKPKEKFQIVACPQNIAQTQVMSQVLSKLDKKDLNNSNTAIILADENLLFPVLNHIPQSVDKLNVTMGSPFKNTPFFSFINSFLLMNLGYLKYNKKRFYYKDLFQFIDDPYFRKISDNESIRKLKDYITHNNIVFVSSQEINNCLNKDLIHDIFDVKDKIEEVVKQLKLLISTLRSSIAKKKATIDSEILLIFSDCVVVLERLFNEYAYKIDMQTLIAIIKQLVSKEIVPFKGEPLEGVQLMGILESRTLDFKNVIMLGVNEGLIPKGKMTSSFIPFELKKYFKIPTYTERDAVFSYHFYRILQRAQHITLTYNTKVDDFGFGEKSRFITQLISEYKTSEINEYTFQERSIVFPLLLDHSIKNEGLEKEVSRWAKKGVSPSSLNKFKKCRLDFYYHYLANIRENIIVDEFADNSIMGSAIHFVLEKNYPTGRIMASNFKEITPEVIKSLSQYYQENLSKNNYNEGKNYLSLKVAEKLTVDFLKYEKLILEEGAEVEIIHKEQELFYDLQVEDICFRLVGNVDRVDIYNGTLRIIDYKSGKAVSDKDLSFKIWDEIADDPEKDKLFQVLMYAYLFLKNNPKYINTDVVAGIFSFRNLDNGLQIAANQGGLIFDNNTLDAFEEQLIRIINRIVNEDFSANEDISKCKFCSHIEIFN